MASPLKRTLLWSCAMLYVALIFTGSAVARPVIEAFNTAMQGKTLLPILSLYFIAGVLLLGWFIFVKKERNPERYIVFFILIAAFVVLLYGGKHPEEKIHIVEFGFLSVVVYHALKQDLAGKERLLLVATSVLCSIVGILDEVVQYFIPGRVCDVKDMVVNVISSLLAVQAIRLFVRR